MKNLRFAGPKKPEVFLPWPGVLRSSRSEVHLFGGGWINSLWEKPSVEAKRGGETGLFEFLFDVLTCLVDFFCVSNLQFLLNKHSLVWNSLVWGCKVTRRPWFLNSALGQDIKAHFTSRVCSGSETRWDGWGDEASEDWGPSKMGPYWSYMEFRRPQKMSNWGERTPIKGNQDSIR